MANESFSLGFQFRNKRYKDAKVGLDAFSKTLTDSPKKIAPVLKKEGLRRPSHKSWGPVGARASKGQEKDRLAQRSRNFIR